MNAYPEKPSLPYRRTSVNMTDVIEYLTAKDDVPLEVKRSAYILFINESRHGQAGINNNYGGFQADSGRWPEKYDGVIIGTVTEIENGTGRERIFLAFNHWSDSVDMLCDRVLGRGLYIGGVTSVITHVTVATETDLAVVYLREWVHGFAKYQPTAAELANFRSMYSQAAALFRDEAPVVARIEPVSAANPDWEPPAPQQSEADRLNDAELAKIKGNPEA